MDLKNIPSKPGCYLFKDGRGRVIYVGKAKRLDKRVKSYFAREHEDVKTNVLVSKIRDVDFVVTDSEVEALILENNLIKKWKPRYNIDLKDSKRYAFIEMTGEVFPRLLVSRDKKQNSARRCPSASTYSNASLPRIEVSSETRQKKCKSKFFGPFVSGLSRDYVLRTLQKVFRIRTCRKLPKKRCMRYEIGLCSGPCEGLISKVDYLEDVKNCERVLRGKSKSVVEILNKKMKMFSARQEFERALVLREQIRSIRSLGERQKMERDKKYDEDFVNWIIHEDRVYLILFNAKRGILESKQVFEFDWNEEFLEEFLVQYYSDYDVPKEIVLPEKVDDDVIQFIEKKGGRVVVPKVGEKKKLLELVKRNVEIAVFGDSDKLTELRDKLKLNELPRVIECFDVSHLSGTNVVASMVQFRDGKADKSNYRKFRIRGFGGSGIRGLEKDFENYVKNDDYAAMKEVVRRRYSKLKKDDAPMPDLILIDGGKGQLGVVLDELEKLELKIPVVGIAKRLEEVFVPGRETGIRLDRRGKALRLLQEIRDEAHRFAISYQRLLRKRELKG